MSADEHPSKKWFFTVFCRGKGAVIFLKSDESSDPSHQRRHTILRVHSSLKLTLVVIGCHERTKAGFTEEEPGKSKVGLLSFRGFVGSLWKPQLEELELCLCSWVPRAPPRAPPTWGFIVTPAGASSQCVGGAARTSGPGCLVCTIIVQARIFGVTTPAL